MTSARTYLFSSTFIGKLVLSLLLMLCPFLSGRAATKEFVLRFHFRLDNARYETAYMDNDVAENALSSFLRKVSPESIQDVRVTAYASPESSLSYNEELCGNRLNAMRSLINSRVPQLAGKTSYRVGGEAWDMIRQQVKADASLKRRSPETYRTITDILDDPSITNDTRKELLKSRLPENWYGYLRWIHYREVRFCEVRVLYKDAAEPEVVPAPKAQPAAVAPVAVAAEPQYDTVFVTRIDTVFITKTDTVYVNTPAAPKAKKEKVKKVAPVATDKDGVHPVIGLSTNIPYDITYIPNYGVTSIPSVSLEFYPRRGHFTLGADVEWPMWQHPKTHRYMQINNITLWTRYYFRPKENRFRGVYLLLNANVARYGIGWDAKGWEGEGVGASLGVGYKFKLGKRMFLDMGLAAGAFYSGYDPYVWGNDANHWYYYDYYGSAADFTKRNHRFFWAGPTRVYINIGVDLFNRKRAGRTAAL